MKKLNLLEKILVYSVLISGALMFSTPLLWMMSTALKPIDQTMSMPPTWLPYQYTAEVGGKPTHVRLRMKVYEASVLVKIIDSGKQEVVPQSKIVGGDLVNTDRFGRQIKTKVEVVQEIPATKEKTWVVVVPETAQGETLSQTWAAVPSSEVSRAVCLRWSNFTDAVTAMKHFPAYLRNTLTLCILNVIGTVFSSALAAYGFSRINWKGRDKVFLVVLATMMIPFPVLMVPLYCLFRSLGMIGTLQPLWVGSFFAGAFNVFLLRQFFMSIPTSLSEAARIDGCSEWGIFWRIILPNSKPALMVVGLFQFMYTWNDFLGPLIYLTDQKDYTLALGLQFFQSQHGGTEWNYLMAASTLIVLPVIVLFFFTQKTFIEGIRTTGMKG